MGNIEPIVIIVATACSAVAFVIGKIVAKSKHEDQQDNRIDNLIIGRESCIFSRTKETDLLIKRIEALESKDKDREIALAVIKEKMEALVQGHETTQGLAHTTQTMIAGLQEQNQETFSKLIDTINNMRNK